MSSYLVVETPASGEPKTKAFVRLEDLHKWASNELGLSETTKYTLSEATKKEIQRIENEFRETEKLTEETSKKYYIPIDSTDEKLIEHRKEFELFNEHPKYLYYYVKTYVLLGHISKKGRKIHEYFEKAYNFKLPEGQIFKPSEYHDAVKVLYKVFGKVLPQLAYALRFSYFDECSKIYVWGNDLELPDMGHPEKQWVKEFVNTFYEPASGSAVKRTDFVAHFNEHLEEAMNSFPEDNMVARKYYVNNGFPFASNPEKVIDLPMIRRSAGMYITGLRRKHTTSDSIVEPTEHAKTLLLKYHSPMNTLFENLVPLNKPSKSELTEISYPVVFSQDILETSSLYPRSQLIRITLNKNHKLKLSEENIHVFSSFKIIEGQEVVDRMQLFINGRRVDQIFPSLQENGGSFHLLDGENFIPTTYQVDIAIELHANIERDTLLKCGYTIHKTNDTQLKDRTFWMTATTYTGGEKFDDGSSFCAMKWPANFMHDKLDMLLPYNAKAPELYFNDWKVEIDKIYTYDVGSDKKYKRWIMNLKEFFGENTINFSYIDNAVIKYKSEGSSFKKHTAHIFGTHKTPIRFYKNGTYEIPFYNETYIEQKKNRYVLVIGSGRAFGAGGVKCSNVLGDSSLSTYNNGCIPEGFDHSLFVCDGITFIDIDPEVKPDIIVDITKQGWWHTLDIKFDVIVDTIGPLGPHIKDNKYSEIFKTGCGSLLKAGGKIFGHAAL